MTEKGRFPTALYGGADSTLRVGTVSEDQLVSPSALEAMQQQVADTALDAPKRKVSPMLLPALLAAAIMGGGAVPDPFANRAAERRKKIDAENHWRISETDFTAQAKAAAQAKRDRKNAARLKALRCQEGK